MKIAIFTDTYDPEINGVVTSTRTFAHMLANNGHQVVLFCPRYKGHRDKAEKNITIYRYPALSFATNKNTKVALPSIAKIVSTLKKENPDLIHIQTPMSLGVVGIVASKMLNIKNIQTYHTYLPDIATYLKFSRIFGLDKLREFFGSNKAVINIKESEFYQKVRHLSAQTKREYLALLPDLRLPKYSLADHGMWTFTRAVYNKADLVLTPSEVLAKTLRRHGVKPPVLAQTNGIEIANIKVKEDYSFSGKIIHFGRLGFEKEIDVVVNAFGQASQKNKDLTLDIIGDGPARESLEDLARRKGLEDKIKFYGFMPHEKVIKILKNYDLFVTASPMETQGLVILEAMAAGLPVVGVDMLAVPEIVLEGVNGYVVPRRSSKKMSSKILKLVGDKSLREAMGKKSIEIASNHDINHAFELLLEKYNQLKTKN